MTAAGLSATPDVMAALQRIASAGVQIEQTALIRSMYAHDASNYRVTPLAVAFPSSADDVSAIVTACAAAGIPITPRGSGTGMAGNSVGDGLIIDFRRHMNAIGSIDVDARTVVVEPGAVLDDVQAAVAPFGLMFGPDPSSHTRATIGGMLGNDACGNHSVAYGRTSDHVLSLDLVLADGTRVIADRTGIRSVAPADAERVAQLARSLRNIAEREAESLREEFTRCPRQVSGYAAQRLLPELGFDIARLLVGSEGTLAVVVAATLGLVARPRQTQLMVLGYPDLISAARDVPTLLEFSPSAIEALDSALVETMRGRRGDSAVPALPSGAAWLFVEFSDTVAIADLAQVGEAIARNGNALSSQAVTDEQEAAALWRVREDGAGLASLLIDGTRGKPGWEDAAVPPERLAEYLTRLRDLQAHHGFTGVLYGHFGAGCVHVRFDFDTESNAGRSRMSAFIRDAAALVASCGGSMSGEHGDGRARSELLPLMYSESAISAFRAIKHVFDPVGMLNPGVIVDSPEFADGMPSRVKRLHTQFALHDDAGDLAIAAGRCVGIGRCVTTGVSTMCPTYAISGDEQDSTRGRARGIQDLFNGSELPTSEVLRALDTCLACKACARDCPTGVDMATYKSELLHEHFTGKLRPRSHYSLGWLPRALRYAPRIAGILNAATGNAAIRRMLPVLTGISARRRIPNIADTERRRQLDSIHCDSPAALLFVDTFTRSFRPELALAAQRVLAAAGIAVRLVNDGCCGLTFISTGQLDAARREQRRLLDIMANFPADLPVIVLEPSCAVALADDLPELTDAPAARELAGRIMTFAGALSLLAPDWTWPQLPEDAVLQTHCHERAAGLAASQADLLQARGVGVAEAIGCCGMGGNFGFETQHFDLSIAVGRRSLAPLLEARNHDSVVLADGFGCACQIEQLDPSAQPLHLAQMLDRLLP